MSNEKGWEGIARRAEPAVYGAGEDYFGSMPRKVEMEIADEWVK